MDKEKSKISVNNNIPIISIVGRPNVGKSTLFNRLLKKRKSIIDSTPGVTRDFIIEETLLDKKYKVKLIDTAGLINDKDQFNKIIQNKSLSSIEKSNLVLFVAEIDNQHPSDLEYINFIRKKNIPFLLVVNKCDTKEKDNLSFDFYKYSSEEPILISAIHNRNIDILIEKIIEKLKLNETTTNTVPIDDNEQNDIIKIAIVGKPNVGKSSILNKIIGEERSIVSPIPGTTRDSINSEYIYNDRKIIFIDTAGIRRKSKVNENIEYYSVNRAIKSIEESDITILVIDATDEISEQDKKICDQIIKNGKGLIIALNKWDLISDTENKLPDKKNNIFFKFPLIDYVPIIPVSAKTGKNIDKLIKKSLSIYKELNKRIETSDLNKFIEEIIKKFTPSSKKGFIKIYYGVQTSIKPVEFVFFINKKKLLTENYKNYIINRFREKFGYKGIPIKIYFRDK